MGTGTAIITAPATATARKIAIANIMPTKSDARLITTTLSSGPSNQSPAVICHTSRRALSRQRERARIEIEAAKAMLANPDIGVTQIAHRLGVSPATLYRYIPAARTANTPGV